MKTLIKATIIPNCKHKYDKEAYDLCSVMRNISVNGVKYVLHFLPPNMIMEFITMIAKLQKLELMIENGMNIFINTNQANNSNVFRRDLFVKILSMVIRHPFFIWGHNHGIIDAEEIMTSVNLLTSKKEIPGEKIKNTLKITEMFLEWSRKMRKSGLK